jgi:hypothetical protein
MYTYSALRPSSSPCLSNGGDYVTETMAVMQQLSASALTPAA